MINIIKQGITTCNACGRVVERTETGCLGSTDCKQYQLQFLKKQITELGAMYREILEYKRTRLQPPENPPPRKGSFLGLKATVFADDDPRVHGKIQPPETEAKP